MSKITQSIKLILNAYSHGMATGEDLDMPQNSKFEVRRSLVWLLVPFGGGFIKPPARRVMLYLKKLFHLDPRY